MAPRNGGIIGRLQEAVEGRTGLTVADAERVERLEEAARDGFALRKEMDLLGWTVMDYLSGNPQEMNLVERRKLAQQSRIVWQSDPQAGAAVDLSNDFVFGRGVTKPKARDEAVQEVIDEAWDDPDNQLILTSFEAQVALNTDLELQCNVFLVMFDEGEDGKVKLGLLNHDEVETVVRDPENRLRILYYVARSLRIEWDYDADRPKLPRDGTGQGDVLGQGREVRYYKQWRNVDQAEKEGRTLGKPPAKKLGEGKVRHIAVNRTSEMAFGVPRFRRMIRWFTAYNDFMKARVDMAQASAAFIMKSSSKSTPTQLGKLAAKAVSRAGEPPPYPDGPGRAAGPGTGGAILRENEAVKHENMSLNSGSGQALTDGQMIRSQISAASHFPQHYLGDAGSANLATATSMELPVLKHVEALQEVWEGAFRWFIDRVIEKAVEDGRLDRTVAGEDEGALDGEVVPDEGEPYDGSWDTRLGSPDGYAALGEGYEDQPQDERETERDLGYEFSMPNPLRRTMTDLVSAVANIARTFDPNNTNPELSRILLGVVLGEGLELDDAPGAVERIFPEGYVDPAIAAAQAQQAAAQGGAGGPGAEGADGDTHGEANPYGAPMQGGPPENAMQQSFERQFTASFDRQFAAFPVPERWLEFAQDLPESDPMRRVIEARFRDLPEAIQLRARGRLTEEEARFKQEVGSAVDEALAGLVHAHTNGNGNGSGH